MADHVDLDINGLSDYEEIGAGGFATVYSAVEAGTGRRVAVKVLAAVDSAGRRRFDREQFTMGRTTDHPNIVTLFRSGYTSPGNKPFLVLEYLARGSLQDRLNASGRVTWAEAARLIVPIADALGYSHGADIIHKDVKPANILVSATGVVKLTDFGIAAIKEATATTLVAHSWHFTPPETFGAYRDVDTEEFIDPRDERSDLYSLAATLYALGTGKPPFESPTTAGLMNQILNQQVPATGVRWLDQFLTTAMAKNPDDRFTTATAFIGALEEAVGHEPHATVVAPSGPADPGPTIVAPAEKQAPTEVAGANKAKAQAPTEVAPAKEQAPTEVAGANKAKERAEPQRQRQPSRNRSEPPSRASVKERARSISPEQYLACEVCGASVKAKNLVSHHDKQHPEPRRENGGVAEQRGTAQRRPRRQPAPQTPRRRPTEDRHPSEREKPIPASNVAAVSETAGDPEASATTAPARSVATVLRGWVSTGLAIALPILIAALLLSVTIDFLLGDRSGDLATWGDLGLAWLLYLAIAGVSMAIGLWIDPSED